MFRLLIQRKNQTATIGSQRPSFVLTILDRTDQRDPGAIRKGWAEDSFQRVKTRAACDLHLDYRGSALPNCEKRYIIALQTLAAR